MSSDEVDLDDAYGLKSPEDSVRLYKKWARTYDTEFVQSTGYVYPARVAQVFSKVASLDDGSVLDAGCGTGLVGEMLQDVTKVTIDGLDISPEMLDAARGKKVYRDLVAGNLLRTIDIPDDTYGAVVSAGTFTLGHVGPEGLDELIRVARKDGLFVIGVSAGHYSEAGFEDYLSGLQDAGRIGTRAVETVPIYQGEEHEHASDDARVLIFRKTG